MEIHEIMTTHICSIPSDATLVEAAEWMSRHDLGFLPVVEHGLPVGVVTDRDIVIRGVAQGDNPRQTTVARVMTAGVETINMHASVEEAAQRMRTSQIRRLLVEDINGRIVGVVTLGDLAVAVPDAQLTGETLEDVSRNPR